MPGSRYEAWNKRYKLGRFAPQPPAKPPAKRPQGGLQGLLNELSQGPIQRSDTDWAALLDPRVKPFTDSIDAATLNNRARSEYMFETAAAANKGLSEGFLGMLTGGKTGVEAEQYSKEQFGGSYLGAQAMSMATDKLRELTSDWDDREWAISGEYLKAMQQVPAIREELRAQIEKTDIDDYERKFKIGTLLLDETYRQAQLGEEKRQFNEQMGLARGELGVKGVNAKSGFVRAQTGVKNAELRAAELELKRARQEYAKSKDAAARRLAQQRINISRESLRLQQQKAKGKGSVAQKAETDLALDILKNSEVILGTPKKYSRKREGAMSYTQAYDYVYGLAEAVMPGRKPQYINQWVKARLRALGLGKVDPKPRRG